MPRDPARQDPRPAGTERGSGSVDFATAAETQHRTAVRLANPTRPTVTRRARESESEDMGFEVDFLPVGDGGRSGDAIALRYGNLFGARAEQTVIVIDGGFIDDGEALVEHIKRYYATDFVDVVVSTHSDADHINGLRVVLEQLGVGQLWMHLPAQHSMTLAAARAAGWSTLRLAKAELARSLSAVDDLAALAERLDVPVVEPFTGVSTANSQFVVVGPRKELYEDLLPEFCADRQPSTLAKVLQAIRALVTETLWDESLGEDGETSALNESSVVSLLTVDGKSLLFTGDAGLIALADAADTLDGVGFDWSTVRFMQIPHHGSRRNVSPSILDRYLGPKGQQVATKYAFVSAAPDGAPKHPSKRVTNAFIRRGSTVVATVGTHVAYWSDAPGRGWSPLVAVPFYSTFEE
jgi:beta-lactamase superfamily II metal-dependent hydrolase